MSSASAKPAIGKAVVVQANNFQFLIQDNIIYQYAVSFTPEVDNKTTRYGLVSELREELGMYSFDGTMLFLQKRVDDKDYPLRDRQGNEVTVTLTFTKALPPGENELPIQLYNMLCRKILRILKLRQIGRKYFDPTRPVDIPQHNVQLWPGYFTAINMMDAGLMLVVDVAHKVLRTDTVLDYLMDLKGRGNANRMQDLATANLLGQVVLTRYNNKTYRIDDIDWEMSPASKFQRKDGTMMSFQEYYATAYSKSIKERDQPLLVHRHHRKGQPDEVIYLIPEFCFLTGISDTMRRDYNVMRDLATHTRIAPKVRGQQMIEFVNMVSEIPEARNELQSWNMTIQNQMLDINGRNYGGEKIFFGGSKVINVDPRKAEWTNDLKNSHVIRALEMKKWMLVFPSQYEVDAKSFFQNLKQTGEEVGMRVHQPKIVSLPDDRTNTYLDHIKRWLVPDVDCVVCLLSNNNKERYDRLKCLLTLEYPTVSQCVVIRSVNKPKILKSVCNKIALQINCKMGGELWGVNIPIKNAMIMGIDIGPKASSGGKSVVAVCASMSQGYTKFETRAIIQQNQELITNFRDVLIAMLRKWFDHNKALPQYLIVYRDGVGEGMQPAVEETELPQFQQAFEHFGENYKPRLAYIIVKKRVHTRLFEKRSGQLENPTPGTCVDSGCTTPGAYNFYLVSQHVNEGTVTPAHYVVLRDTTGFQKEHLQALTYKLTHMYYNWPGTIRVPAVCQYAHKLAYLIGQTLHQEPDPVLAGKLYYL